MISPASIKSKFAIEPKGDNEEAAFGTSRERQEIQHMSRMEEGMPSLTCEKEKESTSVTEETFSEERGEAPPNEDLVTAAWRETEAEQNRMCSFIAAAFLLGVLAIMALLFALGLRNKQESQFMVDPNV